MKEKIKTDSEYLEFLWPMRHYLITCGDFGKKSNIITVSFCMPVSKEPPLIACAIGSKSYSCELIRNHKEFIVNVPLQEFKQQIYFCGYHSGRQVDKFSQTGLIPKAARRVKAPILQECVAHMECAVRNEVESGDKILFIGEVIEAYANEDLIKGITAPLYAQGEFPKKIYGTRFR